MLTKSDLDKMVQVADTWVYVDGDYGGTYVSMAWAEEMDDNVKVLVTEVRRLQAELLKLHGALEVIVSVGVGGASR